MENDKAVFELGGVKVVDCKFCGMKPNEVTGKPVRLPLKISKGLACLSCNTKVEILIRNFQEYTDIEKGGLARMWNKANIEQSPIVKKSIEFQEKYSNDKPQDIIEENPTPESLQTLDEKLFNDGPDVLTFEEKIKLFIESAEIKKQANIEIKNAQNIIDALQESLVDDFMDKEIISMKIYGKNIYFHKQAYAKVKPQDPECSTALPEDKQLALKTLRTLGLDEYITIGTMALSGYIRSLEKDGESMPDELAKVISFEPKTSLRVRKG